MNNNDFQRLLTTNDRELVQQLTSRKKSGGGGGKGGGKGQGKGKDDKAIARIARANKYKQKALEREEKEAEDNKYRDRAALRRDMKDEYEKVAAEFENHGEVSVEQSKYLGGDLEHTHLVKGLDFALLNKVRAELNKQKKVEEVQKAKQQRKPGEKGKRTFENRIAKNVWLTVVDTLHPHHSTFKERVQRMGKAIAQGHRIRNAPTMFLPGRMAYEFDTELEMGRTDIPRIVYMSKEEVAPSERTKGTSGMLPETAIRVRDAMQKAAEMKKKRKEKQMAQGVSAYAPQKQKVEVAKVKARDSDDIFAGAGSFDANEFVEKARAEQQAKREKLGIKEEKLEVKKEEKEEKPKVKKPSYFDDAGDEKYRKAPDKQLDLDEIEVEESTLEPGQFHKPTGRFDAARRFKGARRNWVFKLGDQGLGYYEEVPPRKKVEAPVVEKDPRKRKAAKPASSGPQGMGNPDNDAYDELFPSSMMGGAMMTTHSDDSDDEENKKKDKDKKKGGDKKKAINEDSVAANKKSAAAETRAEAKKRKMTENQQWQKIDNMIKKGKVSSMESMEQQASKKSGKTSHLATPAFF